MEHENKAILKPLKARLNWYVKRRETVATAAAASVAPVLEQAMNRGKEGEDNRLPPGIQLIRFAKVRQTIREASTSSSLECEEQPMVNAGTPNTPMGHFCLDDTWFNEAQDSEKEEQLNKCYIGVMRLRMPMTLGQGCPPIKGCQSNLQML